MHSEMIFNSSSKQRMSKSLPSAENHDTVMQGRIDALTDENKEINAQINFLETKIVKLEFLEGVTSQEVDQLRDELMDKEVEIDYLRKEQTYTTPSTTATSSPLCA